MTTKKFIAIITAAYRVIIAGFTGTLAVICVVLGFASFLGWTPWENDKIPSVTLLLLGLALGPLAFAFIMLERGQQALKEDVQRALTKPAVEQLQHLITPPMVKAQLSMVCHDSLVRWAKNIEMAVSQQRVPIEEGDFVHYYKETLRKYPRRTFYATSICHENNLWARPEIPRAIEEFTKTGKMTRIFLMLPGEEENGNEILEQQLHMGVEVYTIKRDDVPNHHRHLFLVEEYGVIAWDVTHSNPQMTGATEAFMTVNDRETMKFLDSFAWLKENAREYKAYKP